MVLRLAGLRRGQNATWLFWEVSWQESRQARRRRRAWGVHPASESAEPAFGEPQELEDALGQGIYTSKPCGTQVWGKLHSPLSWVLPKRTSSSAEEVLSGVIKWQRRGRYEPKRKLSRADQVVACDSTFTLILPAEAQHSTLLGPIFLSCRDKMIFTWFYIYARKQGCSFS